MHKKLLLGRKKYKLVLPWVFIGQYDIIEHLLQRKCLQFYTNLFLLLGYASSRGCDNRCIIVKVRTVDEHLSTSISPEIYFNLYSL